MKKDQIRLGGIYLAKVTNKLVPVRLDNESRHGGWDATNLATNKKVRIKSAQSLREPAPLAAAAPEATTVTEAAPNAAHTAKERGTPAKTGDDSAAKALGIVGAAIRVLEDHQNQTPLNCSEMVGEMQTKGYWQPRKGGKTPANTLYAAILREINIKAEASRFRKTERGRFLLSTSI